MNTFVKQEPMEELIEGINILANAVKSTLGPKGKFVIIEEPYKNPVVTKDGVTVAKAITLEDDFHQLAVSVVRQSAEKTVDKVGDGPQPLWSKILTNNGWTTMGEINVGDKICGTKGSTQEVIGVFPKGEKEIYEVHFHGGRVVECCEDHLWNVTTNYGVEKTLTLKQIIDSGKVKNLTKNGSNIYGFYTPKTYVEFEEKKVPLDPYLLGLLIGNGSLSGTEPIELSISKDKEYVLSNIPSDVQFTYDWIDEKNYFRVKFTEDLKEPLAALGLYGTKSKTKFIPELYLYNSTLIRERLLQGLLDTDGYINDKGLFEYSTVSENLYNSFQELVYSLGIRTNPLKYTRDNDHESYLDTPIYRITELKGYKYGDKIVDVIKTGKTTKMRCIKVSNPDELYITDGFIATHNTTSSIVLAQELILEGKKLIDKGVSPIKIKNGLEKALKWILDNYNGIQEDLETKDKIRQISTIAANNDEFVGNIIADAFEMSGTDGFISVIEHQSSKTLLEKVDGTRYKGGFLDPWFSTDDEKTEAKYKDVHILIHEDKLKDVMGISKLLEHVYAQNKALLIIAKDYTPQMVHFLLTNKNQIGLKVIATNAEGMGGRQKEIFKDLAVITGATIISDENTLSIKSMDFDKHLGYAEQVISTKEHTTLFGGKGSEEEIAKRITIAKAQLEAEPKKIIKDRIRARIATLNGGVVLLKVGAYTQGELREKLDRIDDSLHATKAAIDSGIVPGGGKVYLELANKLSEFKLDGDEQEAVKLLIKSLRSPLRTIAENAGIDNTDQIFWNIEKENNVWYGYDALNDKYVDLKEVGIIDPALVSMNVLTNAISVAVIVLMTSCAIVFDAEKSKMLQGNAPSI